MITQTTFNLTAKRRGCHLVTQEVLEHLPKPLPKAGHLPMKYRNLKIRKLLFCFILNTLRFTLHDYPVSLQQGQFSLMVMIKKYLFEVNIFVRDHE